MENGLNASLSPCSLFLSVKSLKYFNKMKYLMEKRRFELRVKCLPIHSHFSILHLLLLDKCLVNIYISMFKIIIKNVNSENIYYTLKNNHINKIDFTT